MAVRAELRFTDGARALLAIPMRERPMDPFYRHLLGRDGGLARRAGVLGQILGGRGLVVGNPIRADLIALYAALESMEMRVVDWMNCRLGEELLHRSRVEWIPDDSGAFAVFTLVPAPPSSAPSWACPSARS